MKKMVSKVVRWFNNHCDSLLLWGGIVILFWCIYGISVICFFQKSGNTSACWSNAGTFGDLFGGLTCIFSGFAFAGLIITIRQQKTAIDLQKSELAETRKEIHAQTLQFQQQTLQFQKENELLKSQARKEDIYKRLEILRYLENNIQTTKDHIDIHNHIYETKQVCGREAIQEINDKIISFFNRIKLHDELNQKAIVFYSSEILLAYQSLQPWFIFILDLFNDVKSFFRAETDEIRRFYRIIIGMLPIQAKLLLCVFRECEVRGEIIEELIDREYIHPNTLIKEFEKKEIRKLFCDVVFNNVNVVEACSQLRTMLNEDKLRF